MDLLLAGWSIRDIGHRLSWWDLRTFIRNLPPDSYLCRHLRPEDVMEYKLMQPDVQILGEIHDRLQEYPYWRAGQMDKSPEGLISRVVNSKKKSEREKTKKRMTSQEIRAAVAASMR